MMEEEDAAPQVQPKQIEQKDELYFNQLQRYYRYYYPTEMIFRWLSYDYTSKSKQEQEQNMAKIMNRREFSFEEYIQGAEIYCRYSSFDTMQKLQEKLTARTSYCQKIDIGAVFNKKPQKGLSDLKPEQKEFVIDIDMTDYDPTRNCCSGATICRKCWKFMKVACEVLYQALANDFGFQSILWVYSGRRGIHLWVCDEQARMMNNRQRHSIVSYLSLCEGKSHAVKTPIRKTGNHPTVKRAIEITGRYFKEIILKDQDLFANEAKRVQTQQQIIEYVKGQDSQFGKILEDQWNRETLNGANSEQLWQTLIRLKNDHESDCRQKKKPYVLTEIDKEIIMMLLYPRLDAHVSTTINHLLKAPFCIHPKSLRVCVPFTYKEFQQFVPEEVPTLTDIINELQTEYKAAESAKRAESFPLYPFLGEESKVLGSYIKIMKDFLDNYKKIQLNKQGRLEENQNLF